MKINPTTRRLGALILAALSLSACSKGFDASKADPVAAVGGGNTGLGTGGGSNDPTPGQQWQAVKSSTDGAVESGATQAGYSMNSGSLVIRVDQARQALVFILPLPTSFLLPVASGAIPELPGASYEMMPQANGSMGMGIVIPLHYLIRGANFANYGTLPNGEALPFIPSGEAHGFAITFPQKQNYRLHFYFTVNAAAVFVETPDLKFPPALALLPTVGIPVKNAAKTQVVGYVGIVPNRGLFSSGVYLSTRLPQQVAVLIDSLLQF